MSYDEQLRDLDARKQTAREMGGAEKLAKRDAQGLMNARSRLDSLLDEGSFREVGLLARSALKADRDTTPADGKVSGFGRVGGRDVAVVSNDLTVKGASSSATSMPKRTATPTKR